MYGRKWQYRDHHNEIWAIFLILTVIFKGITIYWVRKTGQHLDVLLSQKTMK